MLVARRVDKGMEGENAAEEEAHEGSGRTVTMEALDVHLGLRLDAMDEVELRKDSIYDVDTVPADFGSLLHDAEDDGQQDIDDLYDYSSDEEDIDFFETGLDDYEHGGGGGEEEFLTAVDPLGNGRCSSFGLSAKPELLF